MSSDALLPKTGKTLEALSTAVRHDDPALVARLVDDSNVRETRASFPRLTAFGLAARHAKPLAAAVLLEKGAHVEKSGEGQTPLLLAEATGAATLEVVIALLEHGADIEASTARMGTPLMRASLKGDARIVERWLRAGANANARDKHDADVGGAF